MSADISPCVLGAVLIAGLLLTIFLSQEKVQARGQLSSACYITGQLCGLPLGSWAVSKLGQIIHCFSLFCLSLFQRQNPFIKKKKKKSLPECLYVLGMDIKGSIKQAYILTVSK